MAIYLSKTRDQRRARCALNNIEYLKNNENEKMRWKLDGANPYGEHEAFWTEIKLYEAFGEGYINWKILNLALDKIESTKNGSWMFE